jgi:hypothetical protein
MQAIAARSYAWIRVPQPCRAACLVQSREAHCRFQRFHHAIKNNACRLEVMQQRSSKDKIVRAILDGVMKDVDPTHL